jgi:Family of unknown function (DUF6152)
LCGLRRYETIAVWEVGALKARLIVFAAGVGLAVSGLPALAHHSFAAEYDAKNKIELKGVVTKFEWTNPHAHFYIDVKDAAGKVVNWNLELASPNMMQRNGWTRHSLKEGDVVVVVASRSKDNTATASADTITLSDGHKLTFMADPEAQAAK